MLRHAFLRSFAKICGLAALPWTAEVRTPQHKIILQTSPVAGFQYHDGITVWPVLRIGNGIDPANAFGCGLLLVRQI